MKKNKFKVFVPIQKMDKQNKLVWGYASTEMQDSDGEVVEREAVVNAWDDYMQWANIREMHQLSAVGKTKEYMHDDKGTWIAAKIVDENAWKKVEEGVYMGFSLGGDILKKVGKKIKEIIIDEISVVDRPANPGAKFEMAKRKNNGTGFVAVNEERKNLEVGAVEDNNKENMPEENKYNTTHFSSTSETVPEEETEEKEKYEKNEDEVEETEEETKEEEVEEKEKDDDTGEENEEEEDEEEEDEEDENSSVRNSKLTDYGGGD